MLPPHRGVRCLLALADDVQDSAHQRLATRAAAEGVSLNQLAATYLAHGLAEGPG